MIYGDRVRLRADERADLPHFVTWLNDPEVRAGLSIYLPLSQAVEDNWFEAMLKQPHDQHPMAIEARLEGDGADGGWKLIGNCGFHEIDWRCRSGELGIFIGDRTYWNNGYGTEVMRLLLWHGFSTLNLNRVFLRVLSTNPRAIRCYEKAGFVHEGRFRQAAFHDGQYADLLFMSVLRSEWSDRQGV